MRSWVCCDLFFPKQHEYCKLSPKANAATMATEDENGSETIEDKTRSYKIQLAMIRMETERRNHEREREMRDKIRRQQEAEWQHRLLESAFDGDDREIIKVFRELAGRDDADIGTSNSDEVTVMIKTRHVHELVNCRDPNGNTPLSEASAGGHPTTINLLIEKGADPNTSGYFNRTALYRAAFGGHLEACQVLLRNGADPRIYADDGQTPVMVASLPSVEALLRSWDLTVTESMLNTISITDSLAENKSKMLKDVESEKLRQMYIKAHVEWNKQYKELMKARHDLTKLENEHFDDDVIGGPSGAREISYALEVLRAVEVKEEFCRLRMDELHRKFTALKIRVPETVDENLSTLTGKIVSFRDLDDGLMRDTDGSIAQSNKWPLVIDSTDQTAVFLRYCDTNYLDSYIPRHMEPEMIRKSLIGAIRYGKPFVLDLQGTDMFDAIVMKFDQVLPGLMDLLLSKNILRDEKYMSLVKPSDGDDYRHNNFTAERIANFKFILITKVTRPPDSILGRTFPIRITFPRSPRISKPLEMRPTFCRACRD